MFVNATVRAASIFFAVSIAVQSIFPIRTDKMMNIYGFA